MFSVSEKISYSPILDQNNDEDIFWWEILLIVLGSLLLLVLIILFVSYYFNSTLNKVGDSVVVNQNREQKSFERINPAYHTLNTVRRTQNPIYYNGLNRRKSDSNYYSDIERPAFLMLFMNLYIHLQIHKNTYT